MCALNKKFIYWVQGEISAENATIAYDTIETYASAIGYKCITLMKPIAKKKKVSS
jgi:hypothetical protein